jgi:hypothetical protein
MSHADNIKQYTRDTWDQTTFFGKEPHPWLCSCCESVLHGDEEYCYGPAEWDPDCDFSHAPIKKPEKLLTYNEWCLIQWYWHQGYKFFR